MIQGFNEQQITLHGHRQRPLMNATAYQVFDKAGEPDDGFVPGLEEHYENLALSFLEQWTQPSTSGTGRGSDDSPAGKTDPAPEVQVEKPEPDLTSFSYDLGWQLADDRLA